jgi:hypothetical protein
MMIRFKSFILGVIFSVVILSGIIVFAGSQSISVVFGDYKIVMNGVQKNPPSDQVPFIYNGRVYVSLRFAGEVFGKEVKWDGEERMISISEPSDRKEDESTKLKQEEVNKGLVGNVKRYVPEEPNSSEMISEIGKPIESSIIAGKENIYLIEVPESGRLEIDVERYDDANINMYLSVMDDVDKEKVLFSREAEHKYYSSSNKDTWKSRRNIIVDVEPGDYYIKLNGSFLGSSSSNSSSGTSGEYRLTVNHTKSEIVEDKEINDTIGQAVVISKNSINTGHIMYMRNNGTRDLVDYYKFSVAESGRLEIDVERYDDANINMYLSVMDDMNKEKVLFSREAEHKYYSSSNKDTWKSRRNIIVDVEPGDYYIKLNGSFLGSSSSNSSSGTSGEYRLTVNHTKSEIVEDKEINDTIGQAVVISKNSINTGHIMYMRNNGTRDLVDYYKFSVAESGRLEIDVERYDDANINMYLSVMDDMNKEKVLFSREAEHKYYSSSNKDTWKSRRNIIVDVEPGDYYIKLNGSFLGSSSSNSSSGTSGEYRLTVNHTKK